MSTDTDADSETDADAAVDPELAEAALDRLIDEGIVEEDEEGRLTTGEEFEHTRRVYHDTYAGSDRERLAETLAHVFDTDVESAGQYVDENDVGPDDLIAYLSLQSELDPIPGRGTLAVMAALVMEIGPGSPVPDRLTELDDESYEAFLAEHPDAVVTVWKTGCHPCDAMKEDIDEIVDRLPEGVAIAGVDGESVPSFRLEYGVDSAPATLVFREGELVESLSGRRSPVALEGVFGAVYGDDDAGPISAIEDELAGDADAIENENED